MQNKLDSIVAFVHFVDIRQVEYIDIRQVEYIDRETAQSF